MPAAGHDYLRLMADQSRRARRFERQIRWYRMRWQLAEPVPTELTPTEEPSAPAQAD